MKAVATAATKLAMTAMPMLSTSITEAITPRR
jgi:hypothetical protein